MWTVRTTNILTRTPNFGVLSLHNVSFLTVFITKYYHSDGTKENEMGKTSCTRISKERFVATFCYSLNKSLG